METAELIKWRRLSRASAVGVSSGLLTHARFASSRAQTRRKKNLLQQMRFFISHFVLSSCFFLFLCILTDVCVLARLLRWRTLGRQQRRQHKNLQQFGAREFEQVVPATVLSAFRKELESDKKKRDFEMWRLLLRLPFGALLSSDPQRFSFHLPLAAPSAARFSVRVEFVVCKTLCAKRQNCFRLDHQCRLFR